MTSELYVKATIGHSMVEVFLLRVNNQQIRDMEWSTRRRNDIFDQVCEIIKTRSKLSPDVHIALDIPKFGSAAHNRIYDLVKGLKMPAEAIIDLSETV